LEVATSILNNEDLFDESVGYDDESGVMLAPGLTDEERKMGTYLYRLFDGLWGVCAVKGDPGTGKDLFGNYLTWKIKRFFPHKRIMRDEKPRALFGGYAGLFNEKVIYDDLKKMRAIASGSKTVSEMDNAMDKAADEWIKGAGEVMLKNSILYLTEYWRYCYNREPHNPMNKTMGAIHKTKRHLDCLIIGTTQLLEELDRRTSKPWIDWVVTCTRSKAVPTAFSYYVQKVKYDKRMDVFQYMGQSRLIAFDAGKPRSNMGDGKLLLVKPDYTPQTEEERVVMEVLRAGVDTYEELVRVIETDGDMAESEILTTLKGLSFRPHKRVVLYPCYFRLYNSKSAPQLKTAVKMEE